MQEIEITKENYKDYARLYERRMTFASKKEKRKYMLISIGSMLVLYGLAGILSLPISMLGMKSLEIAMDILAGIVFATCIFTIPYKLSEEFHKKAINKEFPNIDTKIETWKLKEALEKAKILEDRKINVTPYENGTKKQDLIQKYEQIKEEILEEYRKDYSSLKYNTSIPEEELEKTKEKVKKLVR